MHPFGNQKGKDVAYYHTHGAYDSILILVLRKE